MTIPTVPNSGSSIDTTGSEIVISSAGGDMFVGADVPTTILMGGPGNPGVGNEDASILLDNSSPNVYVGLHLGVSTSITNNVILGSTTSGVQVPSFNIGGTYGGALVSTDSSGTVELATGATGYVLTSNGSTSAPTFQAPSGGSSIPYLDRNANFSASINSGYFCIAALTVALPPSPVAQGSIIVIDVITSGTVVLQANTGQTIIFGNKASSTAGTVSSTLSGDSLTLVYRTADTSWHATSVVGNWNYA
jgi:hypothetical protein